jgi:hypothetical protein
MNGRGVGHYLVISIAIVSIIIFSSCAKRSVQNHENMSNNQECEYQKKIILDMVTQQEAMLVNIPIPLYDKRILPTSLDIIEKDTIVLGYESTLTLQLLITFFMSQMEWYGWKHIVSFENKENILFFENPDSHCCIIITPSEIDASSIFIYIKRASHNSSPIGSELG